MRRLIRSGQHQKTLGQAGFTLIEMLVSVAILVLLVLFLGRMVIESSSLWSSGMKSSEVNNAGRAIIEFMVRDISATVADDVLRYQAESDVIETYGFESDRIRFVSFNQLARSIDDREYRTAREIIYYISNMKDADNDDMDHRYRLMRTRTWRFDDGVTAYTNGPHSRRNATPPIKGGIEWVEKNISGALQVAENIRTLEIWTYAYDYENGSFSTFNFDTHTDGADWGAPLWIDFYIEMLGEADAARAADLASLHGERDVRTRSFVERNTQRFAARAYLHNAAGYSRRDEFYPHYEPYHPEYDFVWPDP